MGLFKGLVLSVLAFALGSCSWTKKDKDLNGETVRVQVPFITGGNYSIQIVELFTLNDVSRLEGQAAEFIIDPDTVSGSLKGRSPTIRYFRDSEGVIVAKDDLSLQLLTVYTQFEKLKDFDRNAGLEGILSYPRKVAVNVRFQDGNRESENNARYSGQYDTFLFDPYTEDALPLMANAGVIGHEHFHAIFQRIVIDGLKDKYPALRKATLHDEDRLHERMGLVVSKNKSELEILPVSDDPRVIYHAVLFRGINEGLADVWGWLFSGDSIFVGRSIPDKKSERDLDVVLYEAHTIPQTNDLLNYVKQPEATQFDFIAYNYGTQLARIFRQFTKDFATERKISETEARPQIAKMIVSMLPDLKEEFAQMKDDQFLTLGHPISLFAKQVPELSYKQCEYFRKLLPKTDPGTEKLATECENIKNQKQSGSDK